MSDRENEDTPSRRLAYFINERFEKASNARSSSGIETTWANARDAFEGDFQKESKTDGERERSQIFVQVTRSKCIAALASIVSAIFQKGTLPYDIEESVIADSINDYLMAIGINTAENLDRMKVTIEDQLQESDVKKKMVHAILQMIIYGTVCIQVPVTKTRTRTRYDVELPEGSPPLPTMEELMNAGSPEEQAEMIEIARQIVTQTGQFVMDKFEEYGPDIEVIRIWDAFPDPDMSTSDVQSADWFIHRAVLTKMQMLDNMKQGIYDQEQALACIETEELTSTQMAKGNDPDFDYANSNAKYMVLTFSGKMSLVDLRSVLDNDSKERVRERLDDEVVEAVIISCGERILSASIGLDADGMRPFQLCPYEQVDDSPWGRGIPQNISDAQSLVNGLTRSLVEAKKMSSSLQTVVNPAHLQPGENSKVYPRKVWKLGKHVDDARKAINWFSMPDTSGGTLEAIAVFRSMADDHSGLPRILEGQSTGSAASRNTATEVTQLVSSANMQLENVIRNIDEFIITKIIMGFYRWNMTMSDAMSIKGDFAIHARGYQSFRDRLERAQKIDMVLGGYGQDPEFRRMLKLEDMFRQRLAVDGLDDLMWDSETIQRIIQQEQEQAQAQQQAQMEMMMQIEQQKFDNQVAKKAEVMATKDEIKKQRDQNEAINEIETAEMIESLRNQSEGAQVSETMKQVGSALKAIEEASARSKEKSKTSSK